MVYKYSEKLFFRTPPGGSFELVQKQLFTDVPKKRCLKFLKNLQVNFPDGLQYIYKLAC